MQRGTAQINLELAITEWVDSLYTALFPSKGTIVQCSKLKISVHYIQRSRSYLTENTMCLHSKGETANTEYGKTGRLLRQSHRTHKKHSFRVQHGGTQSYHWALTVNIARMHKMVLVLGSADCVSRWNGLSCGLFSDQHGQTSIRADRNAGHFRCGYGMTKR